LLLLLMLMPFQFPLRFPALVRLPGCRLILSLPKQIALLSHKEKTKHTTRYQPAAPSSEPTMIPVGRRF